MNDTGNTTIRNRRFLKPVITAFTRAGPYSGPISGPNPASNSTCQEESPMEPRKTGDSSVPPLCDQSPVTRTSPQPAMAREPVMLRRLRPFNRPGLKE